MSTAAVVNNARPPVKAKPLSLRPPLNPLEVTTTHFPDFAAAIREIKKEVPRVLAEPSGYEAVSVFLAYWEDVDLAVHHSADHLGAVLHEEYGFTVTPYKIPSTNAASDFAAELVVKVNGMNKSRYDVSKKLFILYYCGHGDYNLQKGGGRWFPFPLRVEPGDPEFEPGVDPEPIYWDSVRKSLELAKCDVLVILDCCHSTAILDQKFLWPRRCELLGAAGVVEETLATTNCFTRALVDFLQTPAALGGLTAEQLYRRVAETEYVNRYKLKSTPHFVPLTKKAAFRSSILIQPIGDKKPAKKSNTEAKQDKKSEDQTLMAIAGEKEPRVVMVIRFKDPKSKPLPKEWLDWMRHRPGNVDGIELGMMNQTILEPIGMFLGDSQLAIVSVPIWLWHCLPQNDDYQYVSIVRSRNLLTPTATIEMQAAEKNILRSSANKSPKIKTGEPAQAESSKRIESHKDDFGVFQDTMDTPYMPPQTSDKGKGKAALPIYLSEPEWRDKLKTRQPMRRHGYGSSPIKYASPEATISRVKHRLNSVGCGPGLGTTVKTFGGVFIRPQVE